MTIVSLATSSGPYTAADDTTFAVTFQSAGNDEVEVTLDGVVVDSSLYTFDRDTDGTGEIEFITGVVGEVMIYSKPDFDQQTSFSRFGAWFPDQMNPALDKLAARILYLKNLLVPDATPAESASKYLARDAAGQPVWIEGTDSGATASEFVSYRSRTVKAKIDDWVTPLDYGAAGDGGTLDTAAIDAAMATGKHVVLPKGYTFLTDTILGHRFVNDRQLVELNGNITHDGSLPTILGAYNGFFGLFSAIGVEGIQLVGGGTLNGAWNGVKPASPGARIGSGLYLSNCPQALIDGPMFTEFFDDGIKADNCPEITIARPTRFYHIRNIGVETSAYTANPFAAAFGPTYAGFLGVAWTGTLYGPSGLIDGTYEWIDDGLMGAGNGTGVDFSSEPGAPGCSNLRIRGSFFDCLLGVWSENNFTDEFDTSIARNIDIDVLIKGNIRGVATTHCSDGIGLIGVQGAKVKALIINQTNIDPPSGADTVGLNIIQSSNVEANVHVTTDTSIPNRMQHAVKFSGSHDCELRGRQSGVTGLSDQAVISSPILFDTTPVAQASVSNIVIDGFQGGDAASDWTDGGYTGGSVTGLSLPSGLIPFKFTYANVPTNAAALSFVTTGGNGIDKEILPCAGRLVAITARSSATPTGLTTIAATVSGAAQPLLNLAAADFTSQVASKNVEGKLAVQSAAKGTLEVKVTTGGTWVNTVDLEVTLWFDPRWVK